MAVTFDVASSTSGSGVTSLTWSHAPSGSDRALAASITTQNDKSGSLALTHNGTAMALVSGTRGGTSVNFTEIWALAAPATSGNIVASWTGADDALAGACSFNGADQTTPAQNGATAHSITTTVAVTITSSTDNFTFAGGAGQLAWTTPTQTERWNNTATLVKGAGSTAAGAASVTHQWTTTNGFRNQVSGVDIKAATGGGSSSGSPIGLLLALTYSGGSALTADVNDTLAIADALLLEFQKGLADSLSVADALALQFEKVLADTLSIADSVTPASEWFTTVADTLSIADSLSAEIGRSSTVSDTLSVADNVLTETGKEALINDSVTLSDAVALQFQKGLAEALGIADNTALQVTLVKADTISLSDNVSTEHGRAFEIFINDTLGGGGGPATPPAGIIFLTKSGKWAVRVTSTGKVYMEI